MFKSMDTDNSGTITFEELKAGLPKLGTKLSESEVRQLMEAVNISGPLTNLSFMMPVSLVILVKRKQKTPKKENTMPLLLFTFLSFYEYL